MLLKASVVNSLWIKRVPKLQQPNYLMQPLYASIEKYLVTNKTRLDQVEVGSYGWLLESEFKNLEYSVYMYFLGFTWYTLQLLQFLKSLDKPSQYSHSVFFFIFLLEMWSQSLKKKLHQK